MPFSLEVRPRRHGSGTDQQPSGTAFVAAYLSMTAPNSKVSFMHLEGELPVSNLK